MHCTKELQTSNTLDAQFDLVKLSQVKSSPVIFFRIALSPYWTVQIRYSSSKSLSPLKELRGILSLSLSL